MSSTIFIFGLFAAAVVGGLFPLAVRESSRLLHLLLCIAAGFLLGTVFLHLLPELHEMAAGDGSVWTWVLVGLLSVLVLDLGIFGHQSHAAVGWATLIGLGLHAAMMGLSLGMLATISVMLAWGMLAHKFGETFSLVSAMRLSVQRRALLVALLLGFAAITPGAMMLGAAIRESVPASFQLIVSALAAGSFLYVAVGDILPEVFHEAEDRGPKIGLLLLGVAFAALASVAHVHPTAGEGAAAGEAGHSHGGDAHAGHSHAGHSHAGHSHAGHAHDGHAHASGAGFESPSDFMLTLLAEAWAALCAAAPFLLLGFLVAGLIKVYLPKDWLSRTLGKDDLPSILRASIVGAPLPLCSCSVLPTAIGLHKSGASKSATVAFLVSTPETGIDSVAVSAALLDPFLTIARPVGAVTSATAAGIATKLVVQGETAETSSRSDAAGESSAPVASSAAGSREPEGASCCASEPAPREPVSSPVASADASEECCEHEASKAQGSSLSRAVRFGFGRLFDDIVPTLLVGILLAAMFALLLPAELLGAEWASGFTGLLLAALVGLPVYVCASASTPIAAVLLAKGLSPGAALVFLLVGPATNLASVLVLRKELGTRVVVAYVLTVVGVALALGALTNSLYAAWALPVASDVEHSHSVTWVGALSASVILGLAFLSFVRRYRGLRDDPVLDESASLSSGA